MLKMNKPKAGTFLAAFIFLTTVFTALALFMPGNALAADANNASAQKENADIPANAADMPADESEDNSAEKSGPEQPLYPGVINRKLVKGGNDQPSVDMYYPFFDNAAVDESVKAFVDKQAAEYEKEVQDAVEPGEEPPSSYGMWEMTGFYTLEKPCPDIVSITFNIYSYSGGAHGNLVINCLNYNLKSGKQIDFADLFKDPEKALLIMSEYSSKKLKADLGEDADDDMIQSGTTPDINNFSNLSLVPQGLFIEFQPYQVGPWSIGAQRVEMTLETLAPAGPEPGIWPTRENIAKSEISSQARGGK